MMPGVRVARFVIVAVVVIVIVGMIASMVAVPALG
jgi:hypothetical protein